jgi:hypothetical protein
MTTQPKTKGVYRLNPSRQVMKQGSLAARKAVTTDVPSFKKTKRPKMGKGTKR